MAKRFSIEAIFAAKDAFSATAAKIKRNLGELGTVGGGALKGLEKATSRGMGALSRASGALGIAGVLSLGGVALEMQKVMTHGAELERVLVKTGSAFEVPVRAGTAGFARLTEAARRVGKTTEFGAQAGAEALNSLATAGYTIDQSIGALPKVIDFASAASLELGQASDIASDTLGAFNLRATNAATNTRNMARVMDALTRAAADSTTNAAELFEAVRMGGSFAATSGASLEQFVSMAGVLANKGVKGAEAGTAIRNSFLHLTTQTRAAKDMMASLGVKIAKTQDGSIDMMATIGRFTKATEKLTRAKKAEAIATVFGAYTVGPFLNLMDAGEDTIRKFTRNIEGAAGVTREMAEAMRESKAARIARFFNIIEDVRLTVFDAIAPAVLDIAESISKWVTANQNLIATKAAEWAERLRDSLPEIATWIERIVKAIAGFAVFTAAVEAIAALVTVIGWLATAFAWAEFTALLLGTTLAVAVGWIVAIGAAVAAVVAIVWKFWPEISAFFTGLYEVAADAVGGMWSWLVAAFDAIKPYIVASFEFIVGLFTLMFAPGVAAARWAASAIGLAFTVASQWIRETFAPIIEFFAGIWTAIVVNFEAACSLWRGALGEIKALFVDVWQSVADAFNEYVAPIIDKFLGFATKIVNTIRTVGRIALGTADTEGGAAGGVKPGEGVQVVSPGERAASATAEAVAGQGGNVKGTITVEQKPGTKATVKAQPKPLSLDLKPSGAFG